MNLLLKGLILTLSFSIQLSIHSQVLDSTTVIGSISKTFYSNVLKEKRTITIRTPKQSNPFDVYPVLYVLDGEAQGPLAEGQVAYLSESYRIIPKLIIVSIHNTDRIRDLTPTHDNTGPDGKPDTSAKAFGKNSGGTDNFLKFMKEELMPYVQSQYRAAPYSILFGHSLGGLTAIHALLNNSSVFNAYIAVSPSFQWHNKTLLKQATTQLALKDHGKKRLFFSDANEDSSFHQNQLDFEKTLEKKQWVQLKYKRMFYPEENHVSVPVKAFYDGIRLIYPEWHLPLHNSSFKKTATFSMVKEHYSKLSESFGYTVLPPHDDMIAVARFFRNDPARLNDAILLLQYQAAFYPTSPVIQETLGDTYLKADKKDAAAIALRKALSLDPENKSIQNKLALLK